MSCPTCDHTMQAANETVFDSATIFHCPRCGTVKNRDGSFTVPALVVRCREFEAWCKEGIGWFHTHHYENWNGMRIAESINTPDNRPKPQEDHS